jgi:putative addiction module component (TIGR02574 family)
MSKSSSNVVSEAMALPPKSKAKLAEMLLASLDDAEQREIDAAWAKEAEDRIDAFEAGKARAIPASVVFRAKRQGITPLCGD